MTSHCFTIILLLFTQTEIVWGEEYGMRLQDGTQINTKELTWNDDTIQFLTTDGATNSLPGNELKAISFNRKFNPKPERFTVLNLTNDDILFADEVLLSQEMFVAKTGEQELLIPMEFVRHVFFDVGLMDLKEFDVDAKTDDVVVLKNQDQVRGELVSFDYDEIEFKTELGNLKLPLSNSLSIKLNGALTTEIPETVAFSQVFLSNGTVISTNTIEFDLSQERIIIELAEIGSLSIRKSEISRIEFWDDRHQLLSNMQPVWSHHEDLFGTEIRSFKNRNWTGQLLLTGEKVFHQGFGVRSQSGFVFEIPTGAEALIYSVGLDDRVGGNGSVDISLSLDQKEFRSHRLSHTDSKFLEHFSLPIRGQKELKLKVDFGLRGDLGDRVNWCQPYFFLQKQLAP